MADLRARLLRLERALRPAAAARCPRCGRKVFDSVAPLWVRAVLAAHGDERPDGFCVCTEPAMTPAVRRWHDEVVARFAARRARDAGGA